MHLFFLRKIKFYPLVTGLGFPFIEETRKNKPLFFNLIRGLYKIAASRCSKIIFQNSDDQNEFYELKILNSSTKTAVVEGSGVDTEKFELKELPDLKMVRFLMISRLLRSKGALEFFEAAKNLNAKGKLAQFTLVGRADKNIDSLSHYEINEIIKSPSIDWVGEVTDVRPSIQECHVFVLPSYREGLPRSALEAMSVGRAIITTDVPGCRSIVENNVNGKLIPARDASALETAMEFYIQKKNLYECMVTIAGL